MNPKGTISRSIGSQALIWTTAALLLGAAQIAYERPATAAQPTVGGGDSRTVQRFDLTFGKSRVLETPAPIKRASIANPEVADAVILTPTQIYLTGKAVGVTNLTLWHDTEHISHILDVVVTPDLSRLKEDLHNVLPQEREIAVTATNDRVTLSGTVSNAANLPKVLEVAETYAPKRVVNLLHVGGVQQVMLEVRVAEMNRELIRRLGINWNFMGPDNFGISLLGQLTTLNKLTQVGPAATFIDQTVTQTVNGVFGFGTGSLSWTGYVDALVEQNLVKVLAKPTLVALHGQEAAFLAGGEFPIPVPQAFGVVTIQFKKFGVGLVFTPNVLSDKHISLNVAPEVSELDFQNALRLSGFTIPAITTRRASTTIELGDGQSFAIGGLLRDNVRESIKKFPLLGELPIVGALFRSTSFQKNESELLIIVTPRLVKPLDLTTQSLPTDFYVEPNDFEFYLLGYAEKGGFGGKVGLRHPLAEAVEPRTVGGQRRLEGSFGHIAP